jgi:Na+/proline symporter
VHAWGLHIVDLLTLLAFLLAILLVGVWVSRGVKHEGDFYLGGRKLGRTLQFFLNFGNATDTNGAVVMASEVYRQGVGGMWLSLQTLFITPFFWFTQPWFRRARVITMADLFVDRFNSKAVASAYAIFSILIALILLGVGNKGSFEVMAAMVVKPESAYTASDRQRVNSFREYQSLRKLDASDTLPREQIARLAQLEDLNKRGDIAPSVSYIRPIPFYISYCLIVAIYIMLGGLRAAAITDAVQGILILLMSVLLIPIGLNHIGGIHKLHDIVPAERFALFGTEAMSEYTWYSILAITFASLVQIIGLSHNMSAGGSARDENTARFGMISGGFTKRVVLIAWMFCGLLGIAILSGSLNNPDEAWGALSKTLLPTGLLGLMLAGMLLGHMPSVGLSSVAVSGLVTRNIYEPLFPGRSQKHYLRVGQSIIAIVLGLSVIISWQATGVASLMKTLITFNTFFGAVVFLTFFWRRLTAPAILISFVLWVILIGVVPVLVPAVPSLRTHEPFLKQTESRTVLRGRTERTLPATPCFFEKVVRVDPDHPERGVMGSGRFLTENYLVSLVGIPVTKLSPAGLVTSRWLFDGLFPFVMLIVFSLVTPRGDISRAPGFYAKLKTPVAPTPDQDRVAVEQSYANPGRFDREKLLPGTNWEFTKWTREDVAGFFGCWGVVALILMLLFAVLHLGG